MTSAKHLTIIYYYSIEQTFHDVYVKKKIVISQTTDPVSFYLFIFINIYAHKQVKKKIDIVRTFINNNNFITTTTDSVAGRVTEYENKIVAVPHIH